ncbi:MAG: sensor histidine kinase [Candidatus Binataceae bacterium]
MRIGRRLVLVLLLAVAPIVAVYTYWSVEWSRQNYVADLKRETRATMRGLSPVLAGYVQQEQWAQVRKMFHRLSADGTESALLKLDGERLYASPGFPPKLITVALQAGMSPAGLEFEQTAAGRYWFCRIVPLKADKPIGYLLVAQDWTNIGENLRERMLTPIGAALIVVILITALIPTLVSRYVSEPLAELSRKVIRFTDEDTVGGDELKLLSEEFRRLDQQLSKARADLLERHRYELELDRRLQRADRLATIGTLASGLAHEIGTPMGVIRTRAELLLHGSPAPAKTGEGLEIIVNQIDRISRIVRMLLDYARGHESHRAWYDVRIIIQHVLKLLETEAKRGGVRITAEPGAHPLMVECDADQIQQVFINLVVNAFDAMAPAGGTLRVRTAIEERDHRAPLLKVTFEDTGPGVPPEFRDHVFDPFFSTKAPGKGTGMGLSVSQSIMRDHSGEISFDTGPAGTRFFVTIPMANAGVSTAVREPVSNVERPA